ncbi:uncharacterized protein F4812DRAFT_431275 [Daldinia caldariorum]|uniref:uncharacterized protein n=1 Tax=Daldinia caldariorum TaxID=326644 RepID=UPI002007C785|nr:uncharacterized protein F4812DRAFT_431275 [Daldinia caldariorum]KAI1467113.1 hypothetical protein F4812DRAFT_431275 [Daldinia caldariorum]
MLLRLGACYSVLVHTTQSWIKELERVRVRSACEIKGARCILLRIGGKYRFIQQGLGARNDFSGTLACLNRKLDLADRCLRYVCLNPVFLTS